MTGIEAAAKTGPGGLIQHVSNVYSAGVDSDGSPRWRSASGEMLGDYIALHLLQRDGWSVVTPEPAKAEACPPFVGKLVHKNGGYFDGNGRQGNLEKWDWADRHNATVAKAREEADAEGYKRGHAESAAKIAELTAERDAVANPEDVACDTDPFVQVAQEQADDADLDACRERIAKLEGLLRRVSSLRWVEVDNLYNDIDAALAEAGR